MDDALRRRVLAKVAWRLIPFLFLLYIVNILDRVNVGFAKLEMLRELGLTEGIFALGAGIFYVGYFVFEVPSNLILKRIGARRWIARIMISWGLVTCATMAVQGPWTFYLLRILLGVAEAGFFPGIILYLTYWFPARERARTVACFMAASPLAGMLGNPLSGAIMEHLDEVAGLSGWQWIFLLEGLPAVILGFIVLFYLTDRPDQATWLALEERTWLTEQIVHEEKYRVQQHGMTLGQALADSRVWLLILLYASIAAGSNGFGFYLPTFVKISFPQQKPFMIGLLAAVPNVFAIFAMVLNGAHSDRTGERRWHVALPAFISAAGWLLFALVDSPGLSLLALTLIQVGVMSMIPTFWTLPTAFLSGTAAAGGIAWINSVGNLGGFAGINIIGQSKELTGDFWPGLIAMAGILCIGGLLALCVRQEHGNAKTS
jgi:ACS family tartrate transporter-like MFS transporter